MAGNRSGEKIPLLSQEGWREAPGWFHWEPPRAASLRDTAALLTQEGSALTSNSFIPCQEQPLVEPQFRHL